METTESGLYISMGNIYIIEKGVAFRETQGNHSEIEMKMKYVLANGFYK